MLNVGRISESIGYYIAGFVDGEGSFRLTFRRRQDYRQPWKVSLCLNVSQKDRVILALLKRHLNCGTLREKAGDVWMYEVNNLVAIRDNVIPFFKRFGFLSAKKKRDFAIFQRMAALMAEGAHLNRDGIARLLELRRKMNDGGKRKYCEEEILAALDAMESSETIRQASPGPSAGGDEIVRAAWRHAEAGRNDRPTPANASANARGVTKVPKVAKSLVG